MTGFYLMHRGWMDNPAFNNEPFSRRDAWVWLIETANYADGRWSVSGRTITLKRGQLCRPLRKIAEAWQWDEAKVRRFLARLKQEAMIECVTDAKSTVITICNYDEYQPGGRVADATTDAKLTHERRITDAHKNEGNKNPSAEADASTGADGASDAAQTDGELVWGPGLDWLAKTSGKSPSSLRSLIGRWCKGGREALVLTIMRECRGQSPPIAEPIAWIEAALAERSRPNERQAQHRTGPVRTYTEDPDTRRRGILDALAGELATG